MIGFERGSPAVCEVGTRFVVCVVGTCFVICEVGTRFVLMCEITVAIFLLAARVFVKVKNRKQS